MQILLFIQTPGKCQEGTPGRSETSHSKSANMRHSKQPVKWKASFRLICSIRQDEKAERSPGGRLANEQVGTNRHPCQDPPAEEVGDQSQQTW